MLTYDEAYDSIIDSIKPLSTQRHSILESLGHVLAEDIVAPAPIPAFANSAMDGYAIRGFDIQNDTPGRATFKIVDFIRAGVVSDRQLGWKEACQIATGAMLPSNADTVVPIEDCVVLGDELSVTEKIRPGQSVRPAGEDVAAGTRVASAGLPITAGAIGMFAAVGRATVKTYRRPRVAIVSTGDATPGGALGPGQIYNSNGFSLAAQVVEAGGIVAKRLHARDSPESLRAAFDACAGADILVTTGGVSVGEFDFVKQTIAERGTVDFWKVAIRPGKPLAFGRMGDSVFVGLPGNPVSTLVTFELFVRPALRKMMGHQTGLRRPTVQARLMETVCHEPGRQSFLRARISREDGEYRARLTGGQGSGMLHGMTSANGLIVVPQDAHSILEGKMATVIVIEPNSL